MPWLLKPQHIYPYAVAIQASSIAVKTDFVGSAPHINRFPALATVAGAVTRSEGAHIAVLGIDEANAKWTCAVVVHQR